MKAWLLTPVAIVGVVGIAAACWMIGVSRVDPEAGPPGPTLQVTRLEPPPEAGQEVECEPFGRVHFLYLVRNNGTDLLRGLKLALSCQCEAAEQPPEEIAPGATARVGFRLRVLDAGRTERRVDLIAGDPPAVLTSLQVGLRVRLQPPALAQPAGPTRVTFVDGDDSPCELTFESVERRESQSWIVGLAVEPKTVSQAAALPVEETPHTDPVLIRRVYRFQFSRGQLAIGRHGGTFILRTRCNPPATASTLPLEIEVLDRVAIMPNPLAIVAEAGKSEESRIFVVRRAGGGKVEATQWDRRLLDVHPLAGNGDRTAAFAVILKTLPKVARETTIVFEVGCGETRLATVRISPPGSLPRSM